MTFVCSFRDIYTCSFFKEIQFKNRSKKHRGHVKQAILIARVVVVHMIILAHVNGKNMRISVDMIKLIRFTLDNVFAFQEIIVITKTANYLLILLILLEIGKIQMKQFNLKQKQISGLLMMISISVISKIILFQRIRVTKKK